MNARWKKAMPMALVALLAVLLFAIRQYKNAQRNRPETNTSSSKGKTGSVNRDKGFDRRITYLEYSNHAKCRMECRKISTAEVEEIMTDGKINYNKSDLDSRSRPGASCPRYAVEGRTADDQKVRIVFAQCNEKTIVVTVIDLDTEWTCHCPGDDEKYNNRN